LTDLWPALAPAILTIVGMTALFLGWLGRPSRTRSNPSSHPGRRAIWLGGPILVGLTWLVVSPAYWWAPTRLPGLTPYTYAATINVDGSRLLKAGRQIELVDTFTGLSLGEFADLPNGPSDMTFLSNPNSFALAVSDGLWVQGPSGDSELWRAGDQSPVQLSSAFDGRFILTGNWNGDIQVWDTAAGTETDNFAAHHGGVTAIAAAPDRYTFVSAGFDGTILLWQLAVDGWRVAQLPTLDTPATALVFSPDGMWLALGGSDGSLWIANADGSSIQPWGIRYGNRRLQQDLNATILSKQITALAFSPDNRLLAVGFSNGQVDVWQTGDKKLRRTLSAHTGSVNAVGFRPDGALLTVGDDDVYVWRIRF